MVEVAPTPIELQEFQFKLHSKCRIFDNTDDSKFINIHSLISVASRYGLLFIGTPNRTLEVIQIKDIENINNSKANTNCAKRSIPLPGVPTHLAVNCDSTLLAVVCNRDNCPITIIYNILSFLSQNVITIREIRLSATPGVSILETCWNPTLPTVYTACKSDGSLGVYTIQENSVDINELPVAAAARCFCWSPKGKQIVVGAANGSLTQYKPDLKAVKVIAAPALAGQGPFSALSVFWLTNYQFMAIYKNSDENERPVMLIVNAPKTGNPSFINYEDICYSYGNLRPNQYYVIHQSTWNVLLVASANSMEIGVMGVSQVGEPVQWQQWIQLDGCRAELPLFANSQETYPVGFSFDTGVTMQLPWGENEKLPPMPMIHILSHYGVLCSFNVINIRPGTVTICSPPEPIGDQSGINQFIVKEPETAVQTPDSTAIVPSESQPTTQQTTFGFPAVKSPTKSLEITPVPQSVSAQTAPFNSPQTATPVSQQQGGSLFGALQSNTIFGGNNTSTLFGTPPFSSAASNFAFKLPPAATATPSPTTMTTMAGATTAAASPLSTYGSPSVANVANVSPAMVPSQVQNTPSTWTFDTAATASATQQSKPTMFASPTTKPAAVPSGQMFSSLFNVAPQTSSLGVTVKSPSVNLPLLATPPQQQYLQQQQQQQHHHQQQQQQQISITQKVTPKPIVQITVPTPVQHHQQPVSHHEYIHDKQQTMTATATTTPPTLNDSNVSSAPRQNESVNNDHVIQSLMKEELKNFQSEMQQLFKRCRSINLDVGTQDEKQNLAETTESLLDFYRELQETTDSQISEVYYLKQALMQSFAWYEDSKFRHQRYADPNFNSILQSQDLDPVSEKQLADIKHLIYYIESQLKQIDSFLDCQWADFQDACKKHIKGKIHTPTLEPIYQSLVKQSVILNRQRYDLKDIGNRMKLRNKKAANSAHVLNKVTTKQVNKNVSGNDHENDGDDISVVEDFNKLKLDVDVFANRYEKIVRDADKFTANKNATLCSFLSNRPVVRIEPRKPKFINNVLKISPSKLNNTSLSSSFGNASGVNRSLRAAFDSIAQQNAFDTSLNTSVEANLSSSNLFSFTMQDGGDSVTQHSTKLDMTPPPPSQSTQVKQQHTIASLIFNTPETKLQKSKLPVQIIPISSSGVTFNLSMGGGVSGGDDTKLASILPPDSADSVKSNSSTKFFSFGSSNVTTQLDDTKAGDGTFVKPKPVGFLAPSVQSKPPPTAIPGTGNNVTAIISTSKPNTTSIFKSGGENTFTLESSFNFSSLGAVQQSTPKPKVTATVTGTTSQPTTNLVKPTIITTNPPATLTSKPSFNFVQPLSQTNTITTTTTTSSSAAAVAAATAATATAIATTTTFANPPVSILPSNSSSNTSFSSTNATMSPTIASGSSLGSAIVKPSATSIFGQSSTSSLFTFGSSASAAATTNSPTAAIFGSGSSSLTAMSGGSLFGQQSNASSTTIFGTKLTDTIISAVTTTTTTPFITTIAVTAAAASVTTASATSNIAVTTAPSSFSFANLATTINHPEPSKSDPSIFGGSTASSPSIFGGATITTTSSTISATPFNFSFAQPTFTTTITTTTTTPSPVASDTSAKATTFSFMSAANELPKSTGSIFGATTTPTTTSPSAVTTGNIFGATAPKSSTISTGVSATTTITTTSNTSLFGGVASAKNTAASNFTFTIPANTTTATTTTITKSENTFSFGQLSVSALTPNANAAAAPGAVPTATATVTNVADSTTPSTPVGNAVTNFTFALPPSTVTSGVGTAVATAIPTTASSTSIFGGFNSLSVLDKSSTSIAANTTAAASATATTTVASSFMGQTICSPSSFAQNQQQNSGSVFGQTPGNIFAQKPATGASTTPSIFGQSGGSLFGQTASGTASVTTATTTPSSATSLFGQTPTSNPFGNVAQSSASATTGTSGSVFGQQSSFGTPKTTGSLFGQSTFGSTATTTSAATASSFSFTQNATNPGGFSSSGNNIFGSKPSTFGAGSPSFGAPATFGSPTSSGSLFGASSAPTSQTGTFSSGFGSPPTFGQKPAFGSPAAFSQPPTFGSSPGFGSPSTGFGSPSTGFGSAPTFGSPPRLFGSTSATPTGGTFGSVATQENSTFANLANQSIGFGNLVQNQPQPAAQPQQSQFSGGSQFSSWR